MEYLISNKTWKLVDLPLGCQTIGCKWVLKKNFKLDRIIEKYKVRLAVKGFKQCQDLDFFLYFSSITRITSIKLLIALVANFDL